MKLKIMATFNHLADSQDPASSTRWVFLFTAILSNLVVWLTWTLLCFYKGSVLDIPTGVWMTYGMANGVASIAKVVQKNIENKVPGVVPVTDDGK